MLIVRCSGDQIDSMPGAPSFQGLEWSERPPYRLDPRASTRHPSDPPSLPLPLRSRNLHEPASGPPRPNVLSCNPVINATDTRHCTTGYTSEYENVRDARWVVDCYKLI